MASQSRKSRRTIIVDREFQFQYLRVCLWSGGAALGVTLAFLGIMIFLIDPEVWGPLAIWAGAGMALFMAIFSALMGVILVRMTHKVAGPAFGLERAVRRLADGDYHTPINVRKGDYLQNLGGALNDLRDTLRRKWEGIPAGRDKSKPVA